MRSRECGDAKTVCDPWIYLPFHTPHSKIDGEGSTAPDLEGSHPNTPWYAPFLSSNYWSAWSHQIFCSIYIWMLVHFSNAQSAMLPSLLWNSKPPIPSVWSMLAIFSSLLAVINAMTSLRSQLGWPQTSLHESHKSLRKPMLFPLPFPFDSVLATRSSTKWNSIAKIGTQQHL